jgi:hypothetical protein
MNYQTIKDSKMFHLAIAILIGVALG